MSHRTLIGGTAYEVSGGKTLVGGTAYSIDKGKTLVGGTVYEVGFGPSTVIVKLLADTFEDKDYTSAYISYLTPDNEAGSLSTAGEYELPIGTIIYCTMEFGGKGGGTNTVIYLNNDTVAYSDSYVTYEYTLTRNIAIEPYNGYYNGGSITITEE